MTFNLVSYESSDDGDNHEPSESTIIIPGELHTQIPPPPVNETFPSRDAAMRFLNDFTSCHGYSLTTKNSKKRKSGNVLHRVYLQCSRGGEYRSRIDEDHRVRKGQTKLAGCPFRLVLWLGQDDEWHLDLTDSRHNHHPSPPSTHPTLRRQEMEEKGSQVEAQLKAGMNTGQILSAIYNEDDSSAIKPRDIYNKCQKIHHELLDGKTPVQALLDTVPNNGDWFIHYQTNDFHVLTAVFCTHKTSFELLRRYPSVLFMDCTYRTNKYKMPLLDIVGSTACNKTFFAGFGFIANEKEESYEFLLGCLLALMEKTGIRHPMTILTDKELNLMRAIQKVFPLARNVICVWHSHQNILTKVRPIMASEVLHSVFGNDTAEARKKNAEYKEHIDKMWRNFQKTFSKIVHAKTEEEKDDAMAAFKVEYSDEIWQPALQYIDDEWLNDDTAQYFLFCYLQDCMHFGQCHGA